MRLRVSEFAPFLVSLMLIVAVAPARAGWGPDGATVSSTTLSIPKVSAGADGAAGAFVAWQEESSPGQGVLRVQHLLATGDVDPAWPAGGSVGCAVTGARPAIGVVPDAAGGCYVWWLEGTNLFLSRIAPGGLTGAGWPARGRSLGTLPRSTDRPTAIADGSGGVYVAWSQSLVLTPDPVEARVIHLGPANTGAGGWPNGPRAFGSTDVVATFDLWPQLALAPGGVYLAWARISSDTLELPHALRLTRLGAGGAAAAGWTPGGDDLAPYHFELLTNIPAATPIAVAPDGLGGVFAWIDGLADGGGWTMSDRRLLRIGGDASTSPGWPAGGVPVTTWTQWADGGTDGGLSLAADGADGVFTGAPTFYDHGTSFDFAHWPDTVTPHGEGYAYTLPEHEAISNGAGGLFIASFWPKGPYQMYDPDAFLSLAQTSAPAGWSNFYESHSEILMAWYGDIALASTGDGGAIFLWSQAHDRIGLFARRFGATGQVTAVEPGTSAPALALSAPRPLPTRMHASAAITFATPRAGEVRFTLVDAAGRRVAEREPESFTAGTHTVRWAPRVAAPGLYFLTLQSSAGSVPARRWVILP